MTHFHRVVEPAGSAAWDGAVTEGAFLARWSQQSMGVAWPL